MEILKFGLLILIIKLFLNYCLINIIKFYSYCIINIFYFIFESVVFLFKKFEYCELGVWYTNKLIHSFRQLM